MGLLQAVGLRRSIQWESPTLIDHLLSSPLTYLVTLIYHMALFLRGRPFAPPRNRPPIRVVCISDTHDQTNVEIPPGDILIHAGDMTTAGTAKDIQKQIDWIKSQPHQVKAVVAGNHDSWFDIRSRSEEDKKSGERVNLDGVEYLESRLIVKEIKGRTIHIFGVPDIPQCGPPSFAFQYTESTQPWFSKVPPETDILITHCPPKYHRDLSLGDPHLLREAYRIKPRLHIFGHIHSGYGTESLYFDELQAAYEVCLSRPKRGPVRELIFPNAAWLDVARVFYLGVVAVAWKWIMAGPGSNDGSLAVNASQVNGITDKVKSRPIVVDI